MPLKFDTSFLESSFPSVPLDLDFSNDGELLACATAGDDMASVVRILRTKDGSEVRGFWDLHVKNGRGVAFVGGGRDIVFLYELGSGSTVLNRVALDGDSPDEVHRYSASTHNHAIVRDRSGQRFAVLGNQAEIWDADAGKVLHVVPGADNNQSVHAAFSGDGSHLYAYGTVAKTLVRYDVDTGKESGRWDAPRPFGEQILVTPDERYLLAVGKSYRGLFIYDLETGQRLSSRPRSVIKFDEKSDWPPWAVSPDSSLLVCLMSSLWSVSPPTLEETMSDHEVVEPGIRNWIAASAWEAPVIAFGTFEDSKVRWFRLVTAS